MLTTKIVVLPLKTVFLGVHHGVDYRVHGVHHKKICCITPLKLFFFSGVQHGVDYLVHGAAYGIQKIFVLPL